MAWEGSDRRDFLPPDWKRRRRAVFQRDGWRCTYVEPATGQRCRGPAEECDHTGDRTDHRIEKLRSMCAYHHGKKSGGQGGMARARKMAASKKKFRRTEDHPGSL